ncbi:MAG: ParB N-terminal domain-containing protein [Oscillospiraceae bacterium]|nr:ParB N-terminal domain-containing protein [Oscillospiraceae bacterium]
MKREIDSAISADLKAASADSFADSIKMLDVSEIMPNKDNFYEMSEIELLAEDIERQNLKHNLVVAKDKDSGKYWLISGHRRLEAIKFLINEKRRQSTKVPCIVNGEKSQAESRLDLIMLNATQRKYSDKEVMSEYEQLTETLKQLESEGKKLSGRMRDIMAKILNVSKSQVGKIDNIKHNAVPAVEQAVKSGKMSISTANEVARLAPEKQKDIAEKKPDISHKEVKEIQKTSPPPLKTAPSVKPPAAKAENGNISQPPKVEQIKPKYAPCTLSESETEVLARYIEQLMKLASKDDITVINGIKERLTRA